MTIRHSRKAMAADRPARVPIWSHPFMQGLLNQLANPKSILFWGAVFPQFVDYQSPNLVGQFAILAATGVVADIIVLSAYGAAAARAAVSWRRDRPRCGASACPGPCW